MPSTNRFILRVAGFACDVFYRRSRLGGEVPADGPVILVGNHPNGLIDPVLIALATSRPVRFLGKAPLFDMPGIGQIMRGMQALPVYRAVDGADTQQNVRTFDAVYAALRDGDLVCLFPEGISHSEPQLERLKTGAARMALGAEAGCDFALGVRIVPVGLVYRKKGRFRSRVATWVGEPIDAREVRALYAEDDREAVRALTARIAEGLKAVTLNLDRWEDLPLLELAERIWRPGEGRRVARLQALADGVRELRATRPREIETLGASVSDFAERLQCLGLDPEDLGVHYTPTRVATFVLQNLFALAIGLPLAFAGTCLWWLPYRLSRPLGKLANPGPETYATAVLLAALVLFPLWYAVLLVAAAALLGGWPWALAVALAAPLLGLFAVAYWERRAQAFDDLAVFFRLGLQAKLKERLVRQRDDLANEIERLAQSL